MPRIFQNPRNDREILGTALWLKNKGYNDLYKCMDCDSIDYLPEHVIKKLVPEKPRLFEVKDAIPIMVNDSGEYICLPKTKDPPVFSFLGSRRTGKTLSFLKTMGGINKYWKEPIFVANDYQLQSVDWNNPQDNKDFLRTISGIREKPTALPVVHVYPTSNRLTISKKIKESVDYLKISMDWEYFVKNVEEFFDLKGSGKYFENCKKDLIDCNTEEQVKEVIENLTVRGSQKAEESVKGKIWSVIKQMINKKFVDIGNKESITKIEFDDGWEKHTLPTIPALMYANLIPCLITGHLSKDIFDMYFNSILSNLYQNQIQDGLFKNNELMLNVFVDELPALLREYPKTRDTLISFATQGGPARIAMFYCAQNITMLPEDIKINTKYSMCCGMGSKSEAKYVVEKYGATKSFIKRLTNLNKEKNECIAFTEEKFKVFNLKENKWYWSEGPESGVYIPPLCYTQPPRGGDK